MPRRFLAAKHKEAHCFSRNTATCACSNWACNRPYPSQIPTKAQSAARRLSGPIPLSECQVVAPDKPRRSLPILSPLQKPHENSRAPTTSPHLNSSTPSTAAAARRHDHPRLPPLPFPSPHHRHRHHLLILHVTTATYRADPTAKAVRRQARRGGRGGAACSVPCGGGGGRRSAGVQGVLRDGGERGELRRVRGQREQEGRGGVRLRSARGLERAAGVQGGEGHKWYGQRVLQPKEAIRAGVPHIPSRIPGAGAGKRGARQPGAVRRGAAGPDRVGRRRAIDGAGGRRHRAAVLRLRDRRRRRAQPHLRHVRAEQAVRALRHGAQSGVEPRRGRPPPAAPVVQDRRRCDLLD